MELPTTSYAILGLLDLRDWTAYELAEQARRSLAFAWPMSSTQLYAEPKRLERLGLVTITTDRSGPRRTRQLLSITGAGRRRLREWLASEPAAPRVQIEVLLRTLFATSGPPEDLRAAVAATRAWAEAAYETGRGIAAGYREGDNPFPERLHANVLWMTFVRDLLVLTRNWAELADAEVATWSDAATGPGDSRRAAALLDAMVADGPAERTVICCAHEPASDGVGVTAVAR